MLLTESVLLSLIGGLSGCLAGIFGVRLLVSYLPAGFPRVDEIAVDFRVLAFTALVTASSALTFGLIPAFIASKGDLDRRLRRVSRGYTEAGSRMRLRRLLISLEVALSVVLLTGAGLTGKSLWRLVTEDYGIDAKNLLFVSVRMSEDEGPVFYNRIVDGLNRSPEVVSSSYGNFPTISYGSVTPEGAANRQAEALYGEVAPSYFRTLGIELLAGRLFLQDENGGVVINERMAAEFWPGMDPIGRRFVPTRTPGPRNPWRTVVGIVGDFRTGPGVEETPAAFFGSCAACDGATLAVRTTGDPADILPFLRSEIAQANPYAVIINVQTTDQIMDRAAAQPRFRTALFGIFAVVALMLAGIGIYGVASFSASRRIQEVGVRFALGAAPSEILALMLRQAMIPVLAGVVPGLAGALAVTRLLTAYLFQVNPADPWIFAAVPSGVLLVALTANLIPLRRAVSIDAMSALRYE
jgi:predicted permease